MRTRRFRENPDWHNIVYSLLRLGDAAKNNQLGEVRSALEKAQAIIKKHGLTSHQALLDQMVAKLLRAERGEKVEETQHRDQARSSRFDWDDFMRRAGARYQRQQQQQYAGRARQEGAHERTRTRRSYGRYTRSDTIEWLVTRNPKRKTSAAGKRWDAYYGAKTVGEFMEKGGRTSDLKYNITHGFMKVHPAT